MAPPSHVGKPPRLAYVKFFPDDFRGSNRVALMDGVSTAFYALLLILEASYKGEGLPDDDETLQRLLRVDSATMARVRAEVLNVCFEARSGRLTNARMESEIAAVIGLTEQRSKAGKKGAQAMWRKMKGGTSSSDDEETRTTSRTNGCQDNRMAKPCWSECLVIWNKLAEETGRKSIRSMTPKRRKKLAARMRENPDFWETIEEEFRQLNQFAIDGTWLNFDWILEPANFQKLAEGNYRDTEREKSDDLAKRLKEYEL